MKNSIKLITWLVGGLFTFSSCTDLDVDLIQNTRIPKLPKKRKWQVCIMDSAEH